MKPSKDSAKVLVGSPSSQILTLCPTSSPQQFARRVMTAVLNVSTSALRPLTGTCLTGNRTALAHASAAVANQCRALATPWCSQVARRSSHQTASSSAAAPEAVLVPEGPTASEQQEPIVLTEAALLHLKKLREESGGSSLLLRIGVKSGGCSGMSYTMDFEDGANIDAQDNLIERDGFKLVVDPMSLLYLFGMQLDYSNKLIGGGFQFHNPNANSSCGCGKSFGM